MIHAFVGIDGRRENDLCYGCKNHTFNSATHVT